MVAKASIKMDELLASWLGSDTISENVLRIIEIHRQDAVSSAAASNSDATGSAAADETRGAASSAAGASRPPLSPSSAHKYLDQGRNFDGESTTAASSSGADGDVFEKKQPEIPPFFRHARGDCGGTVEEQAGRAPAPPPAPPQRRRSSSFAEDQTWEGIYSQAMSTSARSDEKSSSAAATGNASGGITEAGSGESADRESSNPTGGDPPPSISARAEELFGQLGLVGDPTQIGSDNFHAHEKDVRCVPLERFERVTKELCHFPTFFHKPLYERILVLWESFIDSEDYAATSEGMPGAAKKKTEDLVVTLGMFRLFWEKEMEPYDMNERFFRLLKQPNKDFISRNDFLPYIRELLNDHPGLEFLSNHAEFQEKYAVTVITRIFYTVDLCHSGRITSRQIRKSDLFQVFQQVDEEEDINKVTRYFSYEHFYVLYCRFWELDHDRDYKITREDLLKYGEHSLSHMIVDRIFDAAPRPFEGPENPTEDEKVRATREYLSYEDFIFFMLSEEDKSNECSVRYWFTCVDVDGDDKLNNMEMRSFYAVQLHRMQCMGHEVVPFEDMLCQMMDMIKPANSDFLVVEDFLQPACAQVSGALFDALFNVNKYVLFEQRDPFLERQKREDEFETDWDRFACMDYNRLAMEEEAREEEAMEIDWVTVDDEDEDGDEYNSLGLSGSSEAPF